MSVSGSIRKVTLDGVTFTVAADANIKEVGSAYENTAIPTSGRNLRKMVKRVQAREGVVLICDGAEREALQELAERTDDFPMSYTTADRDTFICSGWIEFESRETEENRCTINMIPREDWERFLG